MPLDPNGKIDLERLELPTGISITRIQGANGGSDRKYFPANAAEYAAGGRDQSVLALPGTVPVSTGKFDQEPHYFKKFEYSRQKKSVHFSPQI